MKLEYLVIAIVALATTGFAGPTRSPPSENRYGKTGNRAAKATDFQRENTAAPTARKNIPDPNGETLDRWRRANAPWDGERSEYQAQTFTSFSVWKPPVYQLSRPYFIPIYGSNGRIPMYFAPQPFDQSGYDRPPFVGPPYLPPKEYPSNTDQPPEGNTTVRNRFEFDDDDDRPIWDKGNTNDINDKETPARPPSNSGTVHLSAQDEESLNEIFNVRTTQSPRKPPPRTRTTTTTRRPPQNQERPPKAQGPSGPSNCVWAVVSCCSANTNVYPERCFEQRGCPGPFWGSSPCDTEFAKAAVDAALKYYNP